MDIAYEIEDLQLKAAILESTLSAIYVAIYESNYSYLDYRDALCGVGNAAYDLNEGLRNLMNEAFELLKAEKMKNK